MWQKIFEQNFKKFVYSPHFENAKFKNISLENLDLVHPIFKMYPETEKISNICGLYHQF
jgi:uncharacterized protein YbcV (DUF1398 family)